jgi:hypothetical protein
MADIISPESPFKEEVRQLLEESGIKEKSDEILGPFSDITNQVAEALWNAMLPGSPFSSLSWELLTFTFITFICAAGFWFFRKGRGSKDATGKERPANSLLQYLFPRDIYTHRSARVDIGLYLLDRGMFPVWFALSLGTVAPFFEQNTIAGIEAAFGGQSCDRADHRLAIAVWTRDDPDRRHDLLLDPLHDAQDPDRLGTAQSASFCRGAHAVDATA